MLDCPASAEDLPCGWHALLARGMTGGLEAIVKGVDVRAQVVASEKSALAWEIIIDGSGACAEEMLSVQIAKGTVLYQTKLRDHIQLLQL
jgi:hypothetical protein